MEKEVIEESPSEKSEDFEAADFDDLCEDMTGAY